jgi:hypothetical protein
MGKTVLPIHGEDHCPGGPDPIPCLGGPVHWAKVYNSNPIARAAGAGQTLVASYNNGFIDADSDVLTLDANNIPQIHAPGIYVVKADVSFGFGGVSTGLAFQVMARMYYDIAISGGTPHDWRWSWRPVGGAGVITGAGPQGHKYRGGTYPYADLDNLGAHFPNWVIDDVLMISQIPEGIPVPLNMYLLAVLNQANDTNVADAFEHQLYVARVGMPRTLTGGTAYI